MFEVCLGLVVLIFTTLIWLGISVFAPRASDSFATAQKSNQKRPPLRLRPAKDAGSPFRCSRYHAAPELTHEKHVGSDMLAQKAHDNGNT